jgi:methionyl-tRNA formyltransferase
MKIAIIGQQDFGKAVLEAFLARKDPVAGVFCAPEKPGARPDALKVAAQEKGVPVFQFQSLKSEEAKAALRKLDVELGIMAFVLQFAPQDFVNIPKRGTIQYHPSLLPKYRGPSSINWPIIRGDTKTGLTIFRPTDGLDEGPVILQKETAIGPDDTLGTLYFDRLFPMGVQAMLEAADLVIKNKHQEIVQRRVAGDLRRLVPQAGSAHQLGESRRLRLQHDPRLQSGAGRLVHARRKGTADLRRAQAPRAHVRRGEGKDRRSG